LIREGDLVFLHFFDIGGEVELKRLEGLKPKLEEYGKVGLEKLLGASWIEDGMRIAAKEEAKVLGEKIYTEIKIFPIGGVLVKVTLPVKGKDFYQVHELLSKAEEEVVSYGVTISMAEFAKNLAAKIKEAIRPFTTSQYTTVDYSERYRIIIVRNGDKELIDKSEKEIAGLVRREPFDRLGREEVEEIVSNRYAYRDNFLIADIRGAFAFVNSIETFPVLRAVELFVLQKLELRVYDSLLDEMLEKSYDILSKAESKANRELGERINDIHLLRLELLEIVSAMKDTRGSPRTRVFYSLCETIEEVFEVQDLADSVTRKLDRLGEIYTMVYDSLQNTRFIRMDRAMVMLEAIIVILIVVEIILALAGK
jgi:hypothetical protein